MAEKDEKKPAEFMRYAYANVAAQLAKDKEDPSYVNGAIALLRKNLDFGVDGDDMYRSYISDKATDKLIDIYTKKYNSKLAEATVSDMVSFYEPALKGASDEQMKLIVSEFGKFAGENYAKFMEKLNSLQLKASGKLPADIVNKETKEKAEKELQKYVGFINAQQTLESLNYEAMRYKAVEASKKSSFGDLEKILLEINKPKEEKEVQLDSGHRMAA
jgi:DNA-directed RNA polymerase beta' subunit